MWSKKPNLPSALLRIAAFFSLSAASQSTASTKKAASIRPFNTLNAADRDVGQPVLPNIVDPNAADAQQVCPGYQISNVKERDNVLTPTLTLAGQSCNVYGNDVGSLQLVVEYQSAHWLHIQIEPTYIGTNNRSWFVPPNMVRQDRIDKDADRKSSDLEFVHGNDPSFWMRIVRKSNKEIIF
jgi:alpha-glucosidase